MKRAAMLLVIGFAQHACRRGAAVTDDAASRAALQRANAAATSFATTLRGRLSAAMAEGGAARAVEVCGAQAPALAQEAERVHGVRLGRASLRMRSAAEAPPWVRAWLEAQGERSAAGLAPRAWIEGGSTARVLRPITVEPLCLTCHGEASSLDPALSAALRARYPFDRATGYRTGDLRGALWVEAAIR